MLAQGIDSLSELKDKLQITERYNASISMFQFPSGNGKQPFTLTFSPSSLNVMFSDSV